MRIKIWLAAASALALAGCGRIPEVAGDATTASVSAEQSAAAFDQAVASLTKAYFDEMPEMATYVGAPADLAPGAASRLSTRSPKSDRARRARLETELTKLNALDASVLDRARALQHRIIAAQLEATLAPARAVKYGTFLGEYGVWFTPYAVWQNGGAVVSIPNILEAQHGVSSREDAEAYIARISAYATVLDGAVEKLKHDAALGAAPPDFVLDKTKAVIENFIGQVPSQNVLAQSFAKKLSAAALDGADLYLDRATKIIESDVYPAERRLIAAIDELRPGAVHDAGIWRLPNGEALYAALIAQMTDTSLTADEIHQIGLREVDRIVSEMDAILRSEGYADGTVGQRMAALAVEERFFYPNTDEGRAQALRDIALQIEDVNAVAPRYFGTLPKYGVEVRAVPAFSQDSAPSGYYDSPALDGSRPGIYWINLRDMAIWPKFAVPTLTYHEAVPGHHFQTAISLGQDAPLILSVLYSNSFGEGWALYSEALAKEIGLYDGDPFGDLGRLQAELHRAIRLVVDTGMHAKRWSREEAIRYMADTEGVHPSEVESEIERYAVWPGQALGYKMGMLRIQDLRRKAEVNLGPAFDIKAFHDGVLRDGAVPLAVLEANIDEWIAAEKARP